MHRSTPYCLSWLLACLLIGNSLLSQTITYELPDEFFVCGTAPFEVTVENTTGAALENISVQINFTTNSGTACGAAYQVGSVVGAGESDISDLTTPLFALADLPSGESSTFTIMAEAPCSLVACIDNGEFFNNEINLSWSGGSTTVTTNPYTIERALLVITAVNDNFMAGSQGDVLVRNTTVANTRPGALQTFSFTDSHQGGIVVSANVGTDISPGGNTFEILLDGSDFASTGDGDGLFELNESITITEEILIIDCGVDIPSSVSNLTASWGCGGNICQSVSKNAIVDILPSQKIPNLIWEPITSFSECFCGPDGYQQGMKITNIGAGAALDLVFIMRNLGILPGGIDPTSIVVDSAGITLDILPNLGNIAQLPSPCTGPSDGVTGSFLITIPKLGPSQTLTIFWDVYFCNTSCPRPRIDWEYKWSYFKECPPSPFVDIDDYIAVSAEGLFLDAFSSADISGLMEDGETYTATYNLEYDSLTLLDDQLVLEINVPCGATWDDDNDLILNGQAPLDIQQNMQAEFTTITAIYQLPLNSDSVSTTFDFVFNCGDLCLQEQVCNDSTISSCEAVDSCSIFIPQDIAFDIITTVNKCPGYPLSCNLQNCHKLVLPHECPIDSICFNEPPGYLSYRFRAARSNFGLPDNDDDRLPDGAGSIDLSMIRTDRLIAGDTIHAYLGGEVVVDVPGTTLPFGSVNMVFSASLLQSINSVPILIDGSGISELTSSIRIYDSSSGSYFDCPNPVHTVSSGGGLAYNYDLSSIALGSCIPPAFEFAEGDSIIFEADYRLEYNIKREVDPTPLFGQLSLSPSVFLFDENAGEYELLNCGCETAVFGVSGYEYNILPGIFGIPPCETSQYVGGSLFRLELHLDNFFPYEYRNILFAEDWRFCLPDNISLAEAKLTFLRYQGSSVITTNQGLLPVFSNNEYIVDFGQFQDPPIDEGFSALFQYRFDAECEIAGSQLLKLTSNLFFNNSLPEPENPLAFTIQTNSLRALIPNLNLTPLFNNVISFNNQIEIKLFLENTPTEVASQTSADAPNTWLYVVSPTGLITDFQLFDAITGSPFPSVNGVFQLGSFPISVAELQLTANNNSCETEELILHYGWNCDPFTSQVQTACYERERLVTVESPPGEIDFLVGSPTGCFDLCDTIPYHSLQIFNGELGAVYGLTANAQMPSGLTVLAGSSQVEYPSGSGNFYPIADPTIINNTLAEWNLSAFDSLANGLPGIGSAPANSVTLQYLVLSDCEFIAEAFTLFTIAAEQNCGIPSNTVAKPGDPICINGITQPYSTNISVENESNFGCANEVVFEFSMTATASLPEGACVIVTLPQGINYVPNSCSSVCQNNFDCTPTVDGNTYTWQLPEGIPSNQIACFEFNTIGWADLDCEEGVVIFRTANETLALCAASGDTCSTKVNTGSLLFPYKIERPEYSLENFTISASQMGGEDVVDFSIDIINCGPQNEPPITVDFYLDSDGDGAGDLLVHSQNEVAIISDCLSETMTGSFSIPAGNLCNLVAYINPNQCACSIDSAYVTQAIDYDLGQSFTVCSGEEITIGVPDNSDFTYQWQPDDCIQSPNQSMSVFSCENDGSVPVNYQFTLAESNAGSCTINNLLDITVQPVPGIAFAETPICAGQEANIAATDGFTFMWQGPGISDPSLQVQTVSPTTTSTYTVTVTDAFNCLGTDMVTVEVNPLPQVDAGDDIMACPGQMPQLMATFDEDFDYLWSPAIIGGGPALSDPTIFNPIVLTTQDQIFTLTVTEDGCTATDFVQVSFSGSLDLVVSPDITICLGSSTTLAASDADNYTWNPPGICLDPVCSSITVTPATTTNYTVTGMNNDGCTDSTSVLVTVTEDEIITTDTIDICEGETAIIHGEEQSQPGTYTFTTMLPAGCDSTSMVTLFVNPVEFTMLEAEICEGESIEFQGVTLTETGDFSAVLTSEAGCDSIVQMMLIVHSPEVTLGGLHAIAPGDTVTLQITPSNFDSIVWSGGGMGMDCTNSPNCEDIPSEETTYTITVMDENGCTAIDTHLVRIIIQCFPDKAEVPNVFTPNGDGINDVFGIVSLHSEVVEQMRIWDRWGKKIYDGKKPWNGSYKGKQVAQDIYIYHIIVGCPVTVEAEDKVLKGDVTLLR